MALDATQSAAVARAAKVKEDLVEFAASPPFERHLRRLARELVDEPGLEIETDDDLYVEVMERLLFSFTYDDGSTVVDRFLRRPGPDEAERSTAQGFMDGIGGFFEVTFDTEASPEVFEVRCCVSDLAHTVAPTLPEGITALPRGSFLAGRLNPVAGTELWTPSGRLRLLPPSSRPDVAKVVLNLSMQAPWLTYRNPDKRRKAAEQVANLHERFLERHGSDGLVVSGADLPGLFAEAMMPAEGRDAEVVARGRAMLAKTITDSELVDDEQVLLHSHPVAGIGFYRDFPSVARALEAGAEAVEDDLDVLRGYLDDDGVPSWLLRRWVEERLPAAEAALATVTTAAGRPGFTWDHDGEALLASRPGDKEPQLTLSIVPLISEGPPASP